MINKDLDRKKTTFDNIIEATGDRSIKDKIKSFDNAMRGEEWKCVMGSGRCASHNTKLERKIKEKRVSIIDKSGKVGWTTREVTILTCPLAQPSKEISAEPAKTGFSEQGNKGISEIYGEKINQSQT